MFAYIAYIDRTNGYVANFG